MFGVHGTARDLGSERDGTFLIEDGGSDAVLKISNSGEDEAVLDLEQAAIAHARRVDPGLPIARPIAERASFDGHHVRLFERLRGRTGGPELDERAVHEFAATHARLNIALRSFFHPAARRDLLWSLEQTPRLRQLLDAVEDTRQRALVERVVDTFEERVVPRWLHLRANIVHGDFTLGNVLLGDDNRISGIVDFGDCAYGAQAGDFAIAVASLLRGRPRDDVFRFGRVAVDGYASRLPFEPEELAVLGHLVAARLAMVVTISAWRVRRYPENAEYIQAEDDDSLALLELFDELGPDQVARELGAPQAPAATPELAERRAHALGALVTPLTYSQPVHTVRGEGVWLFDADGNRLLDAYNNVPVVGHCHPRVTEAVVRQTRTLNTHARYLYEPLIELAERLLETMPPAARLDTVMLVNSGSEANDMAWRIASAATGSRSAIVTEHAYHGVTEAIAALSPEEWPRGYNPPDVTRIPVPSLETGKLDGLAATFLDCGLTSDGIWTPAPADVGALVDTTHAAGGLFVADEVQAGYGRFGSHLWSFEHYGVTPDIVTLGKPMGNGYPVAALIT
ncbi:MAG TPA: aminotransferase class III-fold pyridoxal phosphate-dependent enzyme, partial [Gaiellaceae bacterium]|nr:aminotransferase class III-fold pyridoxal phosphate-dependent enzyme [Gaiellaceae bacterium]